VTSISEVIGDEPRLFDPAAPLTASGNLRRRAAVSRVVEAGATGAALIAVAMLLVVVIGVVIRGAPALSFGFVFTNPTGLVSGGIFNYLIGTFVIVAFGAVLALPIGVLTGLYLTEFAGARSRTARVLTLSLDLLQGVPTIIVGLFIYGLIVVAEHRQSGFAASVALAVIMLPLMARASQEVLLLVPNSLREAADALGVSRWRTVRGIILPNAIGGILTGAILAIARAAGETAPLLILDSLYDPNHTQLNIFGHGVPNVPMLIYTVTDLALPNSFTRAWGAAFVLLVLILLANILARVVLARSRRKGRA
jgi:phosphate transport system permease protein